MKKIFYFKLFTFVFCFLFFICGAFAQNPNQNVISRIVIEPLENNSYTLSLLFDDEYKGNAFMQKSNAGEYYIFLPNTIYNKSVKTTYTIPSDRNKIKIYPEIKPYINKYNTNSKYVRLNVNMDNDYSIKLVSGLSKEYHQPFIISRYINFSSIFWFLMLILAGYVMYRILKNYKESQNFNCYTSYPVDFKFNTEPKRTQTDSSRHTTPINRAILPKQNTKEAIEQLKNEDFGCFNLPAAEDNSQNMNTYEFKSTLKQTSKLLNNKSSIVKLKHTNPISNTKNNSNSELSMPLVDDVLKQDNKEKENQKTNNSFPQSKAELLSVLNITPNKGFYLTTVDDTLALFGFINDNVFLLEKFNDLSQINLQARFYDTSGSNEIYIVRLDKYKAMIEISDTSIKELAKI